MVATEVLHFYSSQFHIRRSSYKQEMTSELPTQQCFVHRLVPSLWFGSPEFALFKVLLLFHPGGPLQLEVKNGRWNGR